MNDLEWLSRLEKKLGEQQRAIEIFERYYAGDHALAYATEKFRQTFGDLFPAFADNWCRTVVDAPVERLAIDGFRLPSKAQSKRAWKIWQQNRLDATSVLAHTEAVKDGRAYVIVQPGDPPRITVEHPSQVYVEHAPGDRRERLAAIKKFQGNDGYNYATLYFPDRIVKFRSGLGVVETASELGSALVLPASVDIGSWEAKPGDEGGTNPLGVVPVVPLYNNPTMLEDGQSDLAPAIPLNDAINKESMDMLIASEFAAFRQRILTGIEVPTITDKDGATVPDPNFELRSSVSRLLAVESKDVGVHEFSASDLDNYVKAVTMFLQHLAAQTRTPPHYLLGQISNASGDALKAAETGLVAKVKRKQLDFADSWEEVIGLSLGKEADAIETVWRDPEYRSEGEQVDAAVKLKTIGVPRKALFERIGATPEQIDQWLEEEPLPPDPVVVAPAPEPEDDAPPTS